MALFRPDKAGKQAWRKSAVYRRRGTGKTAKTRRKQGAVPRIKAVRKRRIANACRFFDGKMKQEVFGPSQVSVTRYRYRLLLQHAGLFAWIAPVCLIYANRLLTYYREIFTQVKNSDFEGRYKHLYEIHAAPNWLWPALVRQMEALENISAYVPHV
jgi:hypothetical protein